MDRISNEHIRSTAQVRCFGDNVPEARLSRLRHNMETLGDWHEDAEDKVEVKPKEEEDSL